ncbi:type II toxin-antitoxin system VapC family toxin [bacterium]|nr:type II toxin-antitoxin system VapC family toxin [bacterium]
MKYILDTHALIWFLEGNPRLGSNARSILSAPSGDLILPAIALAEAVWVVSRGKTAIPTAEALLDVLQSDPRLTVYPLDEAVIRRSLQLVSISEMHDRQIVSTALEIQAQGEQVALLTCDGNIVAAQLVAILW